MFVSCNNSSLFQNILFWCFFFLAAVLFTGFISKFHGFLIPHPCCLCHPVLLNGSGTDCREGLTSGLECPECSRIHVCSHRGEGIYHPSILRPKTGPTTRNCWIVTLEWIMLLRNWEIVTNAATMRNISKL